MQYQTKVAMLQDIPTIQQIAAITWPVAYPYISESQLNYMMQWMYSTQSLTEQMQQNHQFFLAYQNFGHHQVVGFSSVSFTNDVAIFKLNKLYVLPTAQHKGIGKMLVNTVIEYCTANNATEIQLQVNRNNEAQLFYKKLGFSILYEADVEIGNGFFMNDFVMSLKLNSNTKK